MNRFLSFLIGTKELKNNDHKNPNGITIDPNNNQSSKKSNLIGRKAMVYTFLAWIISWNTIESNSIIGTAIPLSIIFVFILVKYLKHHLLTLFERWTFIYFSFVFGFSFLKTDIFSHYGIETNYFAISFIWLLSVFIKHPISIDYSRYEYDNETTSTELFKKVNLIISSVWASIFFLQGMLVVYLKSLSLNYFIPTTYLLFIIGFFFTNIFPDKYYEHVTRS